MNLYSFTQMAKPATLLIDEDNSPSLNGNGQVSGIPSIGRKGRPSLDEYLEPEETSELAVTSDKILENYPFFGTLLKQEHGHYRRKEIISRKNPQTIEQIEQVFGPGKYQVRLRREDGSEDQILFSIPDPEKDKSISQTDNIKIDQQFIQSIRRDMRTEIREEFNQVIHTLEQRLKSKDGELDDLTNKVRRLTVELTDAERQANSAIRNESTAYQEKIDRLKEEIQDLKFENFELQQELKYADVDAGFDLKEILNDALKNPELFNLLSPLLAKLTPQTEQPQKLAGAPQVGSQPQPEQRDNPETDNSNPQTKMQHIVNQFFTKMVQTVTSAMVNGQPGPDAIRNVLNNGLRTFQSNNINPEPGLWVQLAKTLVDVAVQHGVTTEKAANTIAPVLEQFNGAADQLKYVPANAAAEFVVNKYGIDLTPQQKDFFIGLLKEFKDRLKQTA